MYVWEEVFQYYYSPALYYIHRKTNQVAEIIKNNAQKLHIITIAGGGDTIAAIKNAKAEESFTYMSTAGGAFLEWLEGKESPGVKVLRDNKLS